MQWAKFLTMSRKVEWARFDSLDRIDSVDHVQHRDFRSRGRQDVTALPDDLDERNDEFELSIRTNLNCPFSISAQD